MAGVSGNPHIYYVGAASGGVWKTVDGGLFWEPVFDDHPSHSIGALAVAASDPEIVWVGTGEPHIRSNVTIGDGVWKSTDGGSTWSNMGLGATGRISRVLIHPSNPNIVYVGALGHAHASQPERGVYRTMDGGETWEHVLFVDENTGASSVEMDPNNPRILYAGMWHVIINTWGRESGGPGSGLFVSRDAGDNWEKIDQESRGYRSMAISPTFEFDGTLFTGTGGAEFSRSSDRGQTWDDLIVEPVDK